MKLKLISLVLASSLTLTACNSGSGSAQNAPVQPLVQGNAVTSVNSSGSEIAQNFMVNVLSGIVGSGGNPFVIAGTFFVSGLSALFEWGSEDETGKTLAKMDAKLDDILAGINAQLDVSDAISKELHEFFLSQMSANLRDSLRVVEDDVDKVTAKYSQYQAKTMFESVTFDDVSKIYAVAESHCGESASSQYLSVLDATAQNVKSLQSANGSSSTVDDLYSDFITKYAKESNKYDGGSFYQNYLANKASYLKASFSTISDGDMMQKINWYNYENISYAFKLAKSFQELYNMQATQLAYHYACKYNMSFDNIVGTLPTGTGEASYKEAIALLDSTYNNAAKNLKANLQTYFVPVSNKDVYTQVNTSFNPAPGLLESASFNSNGEKVGDCGISALKLKELRPVSTTEGNAVGVATIDFSCLTGKKSDGIFESKNYSVETPYATNSTTKVNAYEVSQIGYDTATKDIKYRIDQSTMTTDNDGSTDSDMWQFYRSLPKGTVRENSKAYMLINTSQQVGNAFYYGAYEINALNGVIFDNNFFYDRSKYDFLWVIMPTQSSTRASSDKLTSYSNATLGVEVRVMNGTAGTTSNTELYFTHYNGKVFLLKILSDYYPDTLMYNPEKYNNNVLRAATLACLSDNCSAEYTDGVGGDTKASLEGKVVLNWADGTKVTMEHSSALPNIISTSITNISGSKSETTN